MTDWKRRRILQAGFAAGSVSLLKWRTAGAQTPERNLFPAERAPAPGVASGV